MDEDIAAANFSQFTDTQAGATLRLADFNGDSRTDLFCRDSNRLWLDYADANGRFGS
ncbi:MAG: hypothetical protein H6632_13805 [Anaerolineales bacterium]|nr:hypothetical protein [Anaerolineales bacterium]